MKKIITLTIFFIALQSVNAQVTLNLKLYIEGYYTGGTMRPVLKNSFADYPNSYDCDYITVNMLDATTSDVIESVPGMLHVDGTCTVTLNDVSINTSYYISICHRNSLQTVSANPVTITSPVTTYFFNTAVTQAYRDPNSYFPMKEVAPGTWAFFSGDIYRDCYIDNNDLWTMEPDIASSFAGYGCADLNGDGNVNALDSSILFINIQEIMGCQFPLNPSCDCAGNSSHAVTISGKVYSDLNTNCSFDNGLDLPAMHRTVKAKDISNSLNYYANTDINGVYDFSLLAGHTYEVSLINNNYTTESASCTGTDCNSTVVSGKKIYCVNTFPFTSGNFFIRQTCEATASIYGSRVSGSSAVCSGGPSRTPCPGGKWQYCVTFNTGNKKVNSGTVFELKLDNAMSFSGAAPVLCGMPGSYIDSRTIQWVTSSCINFAPSNSCTACVEVNVNSIAGGGVWFTTAKIQSGLSCCGGSENFPVSFTLQEGNSCSCDPNDKQVTPIGCGPQGLITPQELTYTVRFQNVGAGPAHDIIIVDTLDEALDVESFKVLASSHTCTQIKILPGNLLVITFTGIELPARINDEAGSNGYIIFSILPKAGLPNGTMIDNTSAIYFDDNAPVITNTVVNTMSLPPTSCGDSVTLDLKVFIDGYLIGSGLMQPVLFTDELSSDSTACDTITVELHDIISPFSTVQTTKGLLHTDGHAKIALPYAINHFYFIAIRHRNAVETWSKEAVLFNSKMMSFDFTSP